MGQVSKKRPTTKLRKSRENIDKYKVIDEYIHSGKTLQQIADDNKTTVKVVKTAVDRHYKALKVIKETRYLTGGRDKAVMKSSQTSAIGRAYNNLFKDGSVNEEFQERITGPDEEALTTNEMEFCYHWIYSTSDQEALKKSGLDIGLIRPEKGREKERFAYKQACRMRSLFLRRKANIATTIKDIQKSYLQAEGIDKEFIQTELVREIHELRESKELTARKQLTKNLEVLGKTIPGAFSEKIEISQVDPNKALQELIDLAQVSAEKLPEGSEVDEVWESTD